MPTKWGYPDKIRVELFNRATIAVVLERVTGVKKTLHNAKAFREAVATIVEGMRERLYELALIYVEEQAAAVGFGIVMAEQEAKRQATRHEPGIDDIIEELRHRE